MYIHIITHHTSHIHTIHDNWGLKPITLLELCRWFQLSKLRTWPDALQIFPGPRLLCRRSGALGASVAAGTLPYRQVYHVGSGWSYGQDKATIIELYQLCWFFPMIYGHYYVSLFPIRSPHYCLTIWSLFMVFGICWPSVAGIVMQA